MFIDTPTSTIIHKKNLFLASIRVFEGTICIFSSSFQLVRERGPVHNRRGTTCQLGPKQKKSTVNCLWTPFMWRRRLDWRLYLNPHSGQTKLELLSATAAPTLARCFWLWRWASWFHFVEKHCWQMLYRNWVGSFEQEGSMCSCVGAVDLWNVPCAGVQ